MLVDAIGQHAGPHQWTFDVVLTGSMLSATLVVCQTALAFGQKYNVQSDQHVCVEVNGNPSKSGQLSKLVG